MVQFFPLRPQVPASAAVGRICAELLCPYPPGIPVLTPGEVRRSYFALLIQGSCKSFDLPFLFPLFPNAHEPLGSLPSFPVLCFSSFQTHIALHSFPTRMLPLLQLFVLLALILFVTMAALILQRSLAPHRSLRQRHSSTFFPPSMLAAPSPARGIPLCDQLPSPATRHVAVQEPTPLRHLRRTTIVSCWIKRERRCGKRWRRPRREATRHSIFRGTRRGRERLRSLETPLVLR